jgi:hypothetical protein
MRYQLFRPNRQMRLAIEIFNIYIVKLYDNLFMVSSIKIYQFNLSLHCFYFIQAKGGDSENIKILLDHWHFYPVNLHHVGSGAIGFRSDDTRHAGQNETGD